MQQQNSLLQYLSEEYLSQIYDEINGNEIKIVATSSNDVLRKLNNRLLRCRFTLRQLAMKFIEKGEFANFRFQKDFLRAHYEP